MGAILDLWKSERGLVAIALIAAATVMNVVGRITTDQWIQFTQWIFVTYAASKTVTGTVAMLTSPTPDPARAPVSPRDVARGGAPIAVVKAPAGDAPPPTA